MCCDRVLTGLSLCAIVLICAIKHVLPAVDIDCKQEATTTSSSLSFAIKNTYGVVHAKADGAVIEPSRPTLFTAIDVGLDAGHVLNLQKSSLQLKAYTAEYEELLSKGNPNYASKIAKLKQELTQVAAAERDADAPGTSYRWLIDGKNFTGRTVGPFEFPLSRASIEVKLQSSQEVFEFVTRIALRHVRRSWQETMVEDKRKVFAAGQKLYKHTTANGQAKFGDNFVAMSDLWAMHSLLAAHAVDTTYQPVGLDCAESQSVALSGDIKARIKAQHQKTRSYIKEVEKRNWKKTGELWMEIDGDSNNYDDEVLAKILRLAEDQSCPALEDQLSHPSSPASALVVGIQNRDILSKQLLLQRFANHTELSATYAQAVLSNFAAFALVFEASLQAVDPSITMPWFDENAEGSGNSFQASTWEESFMIPDSEEERWLELPAEVASEEYALASRRKVVTRGKWTYVPIITGQEQRKKKSGKAFAVYKGFSLPFITRGKTEL